MEEGDAGQTVFSLGIRGHRLTVMQNDYVCPAGGRVYQSFSYQQICVEMEQGTFTGPNVLCGNIRKRCLEETVSGARSEYSYFNPPSL
jgi:hypothetical protein